MCPLEKIFVYIVSEKLLLIRKLPEDHPPEEQKTLYPSIRDRRVISAIFTAEEHEIVDYRGSQWVASYN